MGCGSVPGIDGWLRTHFTYRPEMNEVLRSPEFMVNDFENVLGVVEGDCDDAAVLCTSFLKVLGIPGRLTAIQSKAGMDFDHVFGEGLVGSTFVPIDPTVEYGTRYTVYGMLHETV